MSDLGLILPEEEKSQTLNYLAGDSQVRTPELEGSLGHILPEFEEPAHIGHGDSRGIQICLCTLVDCLVG